LADRPITLVRYPDGVDGPSFFEKNCPSHRPEWVQTVAMFGVSRGRGRGKGLPVEFCLLDTAAHLVWTANLASLELHPSLASAPRLDVPRSVVFDLDPGPGSDVLTCAKVAFRLRELLDRLDLRAWIKTSGSKGLQMYVPLNTPCTYDDTKTFALALGQILENEDPKLVTTNMNPSVRPNRVFVDWSQNVAAKTTVAVYSLRARERPTVSTPLTWDEVESAVADAAPDRLRFEAGQVLERVAANGDLFAPLLEVEQEVPRLPAA
jgi:bifunctional non-homologous end joining protein LigD